MANLLLGTSSSRGHFNPITTSTARAVCHVTFFILTAATIETQLTLQIYASTTSWSGPEVKLTPSNISPTNQYFGLSVAIDDGRVIVGAPKYGRSGEAHIYSRNNVGDWQEEAQLTAMDPPTNWFGASVDIDGDTAIVGSRGAAFNGAAYVFQRDGLGEWNQIDKLLASDGVASEFFGVSVSISGDTAIIGANHDSERGRDAGAAYVFQRDSLGQWNEMQKILGSDTDSSNQFGESVSISGDTLVVGSFGNESAYIFKRDFVGHWNETAKLSALDGRSQEQFGLSVSIDNETAVIGAPKHGRFFCGDSCPPLSNVSYSGAAYVFQEDELGDWLQVEKFSASDSPAHLELGGSVSISGDLIVAGAVRDDSNAGAAYVFRNDGVGNWSEFAKIRATDAEQTDLFYKVDVQESTVVVGAWRADLDAGATYIYSQVPEPTSGAILLVSCGVSALLSRRRIVSIR